MPPFRGSDEVLDREIELLEKISKHRLRKVAREVDELRRDLNELKAERAKRRAKAVGSLPVEVAADPVPESS